MSLIEAILFVGGVFLIWLTINLIIWDRQRKNKITPYVPVEYYKAEKGWWKKW